TEREQRRFAILTGWDSVYLTPGLSDGTTFRDRSHRRVGTDSLISLKRPARRIRRSCLLGSNGTRQNGCGCKQSVGSRANRESLSLVVGDRKSTRLNSSHVAISY